MNSSIVNQALQTHSTKKNASCGFVPCLSSVQAVILRAVLTVRLWITGTLMSGWVFRQKVNMETQMKKTETIPTPFTTKIFSRMSSLSKYLGLWEGFDVLTSVRKYNGLFCFIKGPPRPSGFSLGFSVYELNINLLDFFSLTIL